MSTKAVVTFIDKEGRYHVYKHNDGYPSGVLKTIDATLLLAWQLPRFEAGQFAASFVWAGVQGYIDALDKLGESRYNVYGHPMWITRHWKDHGDLSWRYEVRLRDGQLHITAFAADFHKPDSKGTLDEFRARVASMF